MDEEEFREKLESLPTDVQQAVEKLPRDVQEKAIGAYLGTVEREAQRCAAAILEEIAPEGKAQPQQMWAPCAPMPSDMCRVSPFFPLSKPEMKTREYVRDVIITKSSWGEIRYRGPV